MPVIQARYPFLFLKGKLGFLGLFCLFAFIKKEHLTSFQADRMALLIYKMETVAVATAPLPCKVVLRIQWVCTILQKVCHTGRPREMWLTTVTLPQHSTRSMGVNSETTGGRTGWCVKHNSEVPVGISQLKTKEKNQICVQKAVLKTKKKQLALCPNQPNHTIKGASSTGNSTYSELMTELCAQTHTPHPEPIRAWCSSSRRIGSHRMGRSGHVLGLEHEMSLASSPSLSATAPASLPPWCQDPPACRQTPCTQEVQSTREPWKHAAGFPRRAVESREITALTPQAGLPMKHKERDETRKRAWPSEGSLVEEKPRIKRWGREGDASESWTTDLNKLLSLWSSPAQHPNL